MDYTNIWKKVLARDEIIEYEFSIASLYCVFNFFFRALLALLILPFFYVVSAKFSILLFALAILGLLFYYSFYIKIANAYAFTNKRILIHQGWLSTKTIGIDYPKITDLVVVEPFFERILTGSGDLHIDTAGTPSHHIDIAGTPSYEVVLRHISSPYQARKKLEEIRSQNETTTAIKADNPQIND